MYPEAGQPGKYYIGHLQGIQTAKKTNKVVDIVVFKDFPFIRTAVVDGTDKELRNSIRCVTERPLTSNELSLAQAGRDVVESSDVDVGVETEQLEKEDEEEDEEEDDEEDDEEEWDGEEEDEEEDEEGDEEEDEEEDEEDVAKACRRGKKRRSEQLPSGHKQVVQKTRSSSRLSGRQR